jgi:hypothetical protein
VVVLHIAVAIAIADVVVPKAIALSQNGYGTRSFYLELI